MPEEFPIELQLGKGIRTLLYDQLFTTPPYPTHSFANQTVIVTGSNVGLGLEAARHFYRQNCTKLILAVRTVSKGQIAKEDIIQSVKERTDAEAIDVWPLDLSSTESTVTFADRVKKELSRVDVLVENAGIHQHSWTVSEGFEQTIQVNVLNTFLLALTLLPKLRETKEKFPDTLPHLVIVSSEAHKLTKFTELNAPDIYDALNEENGYVGQKRYEISKLIEVLFVRELVSRINFSKSATPPIIINLASPGLCTSTTLNRGPSSLPEKVLTSIVGLLLGRSTEKGSRVFVNAASAGPTSLGQFICDDCTNHDVEAWIYGDVGQRAQSKVFEQTMKVLETRKPGIRELIKL